MSFDIELRGQLGGLRVDMSFEAGGVVAVLGPNGSGKSTLLRAIAGAPLPLRGRLAVGERVLLDETVRLPPHERRVGYVPQTSALFPHLNAWQNVAFSVSGPDARRAVAAALARFEASDFAERMPHQLSGGERQKVALARAVASEPLALLLDEPLAALDVGARRRVREALAQHLQESERPALVITHDARDVRALCTHVVVLEAGRVAQSGPAAEVACAPATEFSREFFEA